MNQPDSGAAPIESIPPPAPYKDRSTGLVVFGILTVLLGGLSGLLIPFMLLGRVMSAKTTGAAAPFSTIIPAVVMYGGMAVALVWLGIGSIKARRWARALLLIFSWSWLIMGLVMMTVMAIFIPQLLSNMPTTGSAPQAPIAIIMVVLFVFYGVIFVVLPAIWTFFYNGRHVKATVEARDPVASWTDACPLPVLAESLWLAFAVPMFLIMPMTGLAVIPFFGTFATGLPGVALCLALAGLWGYAAWSLYKLRQSGWWVIFITLCAYAASALLTFARHDMMDMLRLMNYPQAQLDLMQKSGFVTGNWMEWMIPVWMLPWVGYLLFIKKFFRRAGDQGLAKI